MDINKQISNKKIIYEFIVIFFACISVVFAIIDITSGLNSWQYKLDMCIWIFFIFDYFIRFFASPKKFVFFKNNLFDLIAILPFNSALRIFRTFKAFRAFKIVKLGKLFKFFRLSSFLARFSKKCSRFFNTNGFKYMLLLSVSLIFLGGIAISYAEHMTLVDGIWWAFVTTTTVGYGDISPSSFSGRVIACILMIIGIGLIGSLTSTITSFFMKSDSQEISSDKIYMVAKLYDELSPSEKREFRKVIDQNL